MSKYRGPKLRIIRSFGKLPGLTSKVSKKKKAPGINGSTIKIKKKISKYRIRLKEKQKLRFHYGITERQLVNYVKKARKRKGPSGKILLILLEMRLDNIVYRLGFAPTITAAKQLINHGHIYVNDKIINIPSFICEPKNIIKVKTNLVSEKLVKNNIESTKMLLIPPHLSLNKEKLQGRIMNLVHRKVVSLRINELLVIEYYSRKV
jgi:small subunit ribosomal protein S4